MREHDNMGRPRKLNAFNSIKDYRQCKSEKRNVSLFSFNSIKDYHGDFEIINSCDHFQLSIPSRIIKNSANYG